VHRDGCRAWFLAERHTKTNEVRRTFRPSDHDEGATDVNLGAGEASQV
jgi:sarcosine oxidase delta subunit